MHWGAGVIPFGEGGVELVTVIEVIEVIEVVRGVESSGHAVIQPEILPSHRTLRCNLFLACVVYGIETLGYRNARLCRTNE